MDWYQKFGLPQPEEGANGQEVADPDADETPAGENGQEIAEPAEAEEAEDHAAEAQPDAEDAPQEEAQQPQDKETRRQQAAARREREQREAIDAALASERAKWEKEVFGKAGIKDPFTGKTVENMEDWRAFQAATANAKLANDLKAGRLTPEGLQQALMQSPEIQQILSGAKEAQQRASFIR